MTLSNNRYEPGNPRRNDPKRQPQDLAPEGAMEAMVQAQGEAARRWRDMDLSKIEWCEKNFDHCKSLFAKCCLEVCPSFQFFPDRAELYRNLVAWACRLPSSPYDTSKGLYIGGNIGVGKSTLLRALGKFLPLVRLAPESDKPFNVGIHACRDICAIYQSEGLEGLYALVGYKRRAYDELGAEPIPTGYYGTPLNVMAHVLDIRYESFMTDGDITLVTTNLMFSQLADYYGPRIADRCTSMFSIVEMLGASLRR